MKKKTRNWKEMRNKVTEEEERCRWCGGPHAQAAHIIPRSLVPAGMGGEDPRNCVPLCDVNQCHSKYDAHTLDILSILTKDEQAYAVSLVGLMAAYRQITGDVPF
jgi:5-methylcytosine-specific restriction endonuclease McrA